MILLCIALVALIILVPTAIYARSTSGIIWGGILGGGIMAGGCLLLKFFAGVDKATGGGNDIQKILDLAAIGVPIVLFCYFMLAFLRLNERKGSDSNRSETDE